MNRIPQMSEAFKELSMIRKCNRPLLLASTILAFAVSAPLHAQTAGAGSPAQANDPDNQITEEGAPPVANAGEVEQITVTGRRLGGNLRDVPRSVTVIDEEELEVQQTTTRDLGDVLGRLVPGIGPSVEGRANSAGQSTIRGRRLQLVIDGVVQNNTLLDFNQELGTLGPDLIQSIEVIRGGTAVFGFGATGGVINITTKRASEGPPRFTSRARLSLQPTDIDESFGYTLYQDASFTAGKFDVRLTGSHVRRENRFDGQGNRIPTPTSGSIDNTRDYNASGVIGYRLDDRQRVEVQALYTNRLEHDRWIGINANAFTGVLPQLLHTGPGILNAATFARVQDAPPVKFVTKQGQISYENSDLLGSRVNLIGYAQEKTNRTATSLVTLRALPGLPSTQVLLINNAKQERIGARLTINSPLRFLEERASLTWGADYEWQKFVQPNNIPGLDPNTPPTVQDAYAAFGQLVFHPVPWLTLNGGLRYEKIVATIDDFRISRLQNVAHAGRLVKGGKLKPNRLIPNIGFVADVGGGSVYASYAQGFSIGELLRPIRVTTAPSVAETVNLVPLVVDNYELGFRLRSGVASSSLAFFFSESELGATFQLDPVTGNNTVERAPERIWGVEATLDLNASEMFTIGGTFAYQEGERELAGRWLPLPANRISPIKIYAYADARFSEALRARVQGSYGGARNKFGPSTVQNEGGVNSLFLVDASSIWKIGPGEVSIGVQNLFDKQYIPQFIQGFNNSNDYYSGQGRLITIGLALRL